MNIAKRKEEYKRIKEGKVDIVVGARSAIFAPLKNVGLVIIDEEHDQSYYSGSTPRYSTKEVATYYKAKNDSIFLLEMKNRPGNAVIPDVELSDIKEDRLLGNTSVIPSRLKEEILKNIKLKEQTMIFLNKRGYNSYLTCKDCGKIFKCPNCDVAMTYHKSSNLLLCHYCSHVEKNALKCYNCGSSNLVSGSVGTEKIEEELKSIYPDIRILRMDADTTVSRDSHQKILDKFRNKEADILLGTQMISKGHDFENVTLVGVLGVDSMLAMNDYCASQKAYCNISQVSGRAGRGILKGRVIISTSDTDNYILKAIVNHSYENFYEREIEYRKIFNYPPFCDILLFELSSKVMDILKKDSEILFNILNENCDMYKLFTPKVPFIQRINNKYRMNIIIKGKLNKSMYDLRHKKVEEFDKVKNKDVNFS